MARNLRLIESLWRYGIGGNLARFGCNLTRSVYLTLDGMRILHHVTILLLGFAPLPVWASGDPRQVVVGVAVVMLVHAAAIASAILWPLRQRTWQLKVAASFVGFLASVAWSLAWLFGDWKLAIFDEPYNDSLVSTIWLVVPFVFLLIAGVVRFRRVN